MNALRMHPDDSVAVLVRDLAPGDPVLLAEGEEPVTLARQAIPYGHKSLSGRSERGSR